MSAPLNMVSERRMVVTTRACEGRLVPTGDPVSVPKDAFVTLTQSEGAVSYTHLTLPTNREV